MILKKVYVANFGKLSNFTFEFNSGLNSIYAQNGYGKTTLATFIKVMLYGFSNKSVRDDTKNERKKYSPWQGGKYGGFIEFEESGNYYKLEKFFGKTEKDDVITLYNLRTKKEEKLTCEVGEKYFGIDADGFSKSIYFSEVQNENFENLSLQARLSNRLENTNDLSDYDNAIKVLEEKRKFYQRSGGSGKIAELKSEIYEITREIDECKKAKELVQNYQIALNNLNEHVAILECEKNKINNYIASNQRQLEMVAKKEHLKSLENDIANIKLKLNEYSQFFCKKLPNEQELNEMEALEKEVRSLDERLKQLMPNENDYLFYKNNYANFSNLPAKNVQNAIDLALNNERNAGDKTSKISYIFLAIAIACIIGGIVTFNSVKVLAFILFACAVVCGVLFAFNLIKRRKSGGGNVYFEVQKLLPNFNLNQNRLINDLYELKASFESWCKINNYLSSLGGEIESLRITRNEKADKLQYFLINFPKCENDYTTLQMIKSNFQAYNYLTSRINYKQNEINNFIQINNLNVNGARVEQYNNGKNIDSEIAKINANLDGVKTKILDTKQKLAYSEEIVTKLTEFERVKENLNLQLNDAVKEYSLILKTIEILGQAKERLNSRYLTPMQNNFNEVMQLIGGDIANNGVLDTDLNLNIDCGGELKAVGYFSKGYKDLLNFATRVALVKSIYQSSKPFLILDDCFSSLDEINLAKVNKLLVSLSKEYQIIYFVCSKDRQI